MSHHIGTNEQPLCFVIGPYGALDTESREWSDFLFREVISPAVEGDYIVRRTIDAPEPGKITDIIKRDLSGATVVVADLTGANPNAYFELGFRHALERPVVHVARAKTVLPFDTRDYQLIEVHADYNEAENYFTIRADRARAAQSYLREQIKRAVSVPMPRARDPFSMRVYQWDMWYSNRIARDWLSTQDRVFQEQVRSYECGGGTDSVSEEWLPEFAEYLALKSAANVTGVGTIFFTLNNFTGNLDFGYVAFKFFNAPEPILINVTEVTRSPNGTIETISFRQNPRPFPIDRGGGTVSVMLPGYNYTLRIDSTSSNKAVGEIKHPHTKTTIGKAELMPKYGTW